MEIDSLDIELSADPNGALSSLDAISEALSNLKNSKEIGEIARSVNMLSSSIDSIDPRKLFALSDGLERISNLRADGRSIESLSNGIDALNRSLSSKNNFKYLSQISTAINEYSNATSGIDPNGATNVVSLANSIRDFDNALDGGLKPENVTKIDAITKALNAFGKNTDSVDNVNLMPLAQQLNSFFGAITPVEVEKVNQLNSVSYALNSFTRSVKSENADYSIFSQLANGIKAIYTEISDIGSANTSVLVDTANALKTLIAVISRGVNFGSIETLTQGIEKLSEGLETLTATSVDKMRSVALAIKNISSLKGLKMDGIGNDLKSLADAISSLGEADIEKLQASIPTVIELIDSLFRELEKAPEFTKDTAQIIQATSNLAYSMSLYNKEMSRNTSYSSGHFSKMHRVASRLGNVFSSLANRVMGARLSFHKFGLGFKGININAEKLKNTLAKLKPNVDGLTRSFESFKSKLNTITTVIRRIIALRAQVSDLWNWLEPAMNMIEVQNYFDKVIEQLQGRADLSGFTEMGEDAARNFVDSFKTNMYGLFSKMTGYAVDNSNGKLTNTNTKNLGINAASLMQYQTGFAQVSSSIGLASDTAVKLSRVLTELGADLASIKDEHFEVVWSNLQSALAGQARAVDKYGINIRQAALEQKAFDLGIKKSVNQMSQQEKALLRVYVMLESTEFAWGDLAETISSPANRVRQLQEAFTSLSRSIGNIFLPLLAATLPYLNAITRALQRLSEYILKVLTQLFPGIYEGFDWGSSTGSSNVDDLLSDLLDTDDAITDTTDDAKKLKKTVLGFDEINPMSSVESDELEDTTDALEALTNALDELMKKYQEEWDKAFDAMEDRFNEFADRIAEIFKNFGFEGVGKYFADAIEDWLKSIPWNKIKDVLSRLSKNIASFLNGLVSPDLFKQIGKTIAEAINTIFEMLLAFIKEFDFGKLGKSITKGLQGFFDNIDWSVIDKTAALLGKKMADFWNNLINKETLEKAGLALDRAVEAMFLLLYNLFKNLEWGRIGEAIKSGIVTAIQNIPWDIIRATFLESAQGMAQLLNSLFADGTIFATAGAALAKGFNIIIESLASFIRGIKWEDITHGIETGILNAFNGIDWNGVNVAAIEIGKAIADIFNGALADGKLADTIFTSIAKAINAAVMLLHTAIDKIKWVEIAEGLRDGLIKGLKTIDWQGIHMFLTDLAEDMANFLNALFKDGELFAEIGKTIGEALSSAIDFAFTFLEKLDIKSAADSIANLINNAVRGIDKGKLHTILDDLFELIKEVLKGISWGDIWGIVAEVLKVTFEPDNILTMMKLKLLVALPSMLTSLFTGEAVLAALRGIGGLIGDVISGGISSVFSGKGVKKIVDAIKGLTGKVATETAETAGKAATEAVGKTVVAGTTSKLAGLGGVLAKAGGLAIGGLGIYNEVQNYKEQSQEFSKLEALKNVLTGAATGAATGLALGGLNPITGLVGGGLGAVTSAISEYMAYKKSLEGAEVASKNLSTQTQAITTTLNNSSDAVQGISNIYTDVTNQIQNADWASLGRYIILGISSGMADAKESVLGVEIDAVCDFIDQRFRDDLIIHSPSQRMFPIGQFIILGIIEGMNSILQSFWSYVSAGFEAIIGLINDWASRAVGAIKKFADDAEKVIKSWVDATVKKFQAWKTSIEDTIAKWKDEVIKKFNEWKETVLTTIQTWSEETISKFLAWKEDVERKFEEWKNNVIAKIRAWAEETKRQIDSWIQETVNKFKEWETKVIAVIQSLVDKAKAKFEQFKDDVANAFEGVKNAVTEKIQWIADNVPTMVSGFTDAIKGTFSELSTNISSIFGSIGETITTSFKNSCQSAGGAMNGLVSSVLDAGNSIKSAVSNIGSSINNMVGGISSGVKNLASNVGNTVSNMASTVSKNVSNITKDLEKADSSSKKVDKSWNLMTGTTYTVKKYATGGFPDKGSLFLANEAGAEYVGSMGGKTTVANQQEIVSGIRSGVIDAMMQVYMATGSGGASNNSNSKVEIPMYIDGREVARATYSNMESMIKTGQIRPSWI